MNWLKARTIAIAGGCLAIIGFQTYGLMSTRSTLMPTRSTIEERMASMERQVQSMHTRENTEISRLASDLDVVTQRMGITTKELKAAHNLAAKLRADHAKTAQRLQDELAAKADARAVTELREEAATKLTELQQDATSKFGAVSGEVQIVRTDLNATREDLANSKREILTQVARNATELAELRRKGERDYIEFELNKRNQFERIADIGVQLKKTDAKKQRYTVVIQADDERFEKKDRGANEPVTFMVGRDRLRYEFVVNYVDKDRIRGYLSTPKDKTLSAEGPAVRRLQ